MISYIHPELVKALMFPAIDKLAKDASPDVSPRPLARKRKDHLAPLRRAGLRSLIVAVAAKLTLILIYVCL